VQVGAEFADTVPKFMELLGHFGWGTPNIFSEFFEINRKKCQTLLIIIVDLTRDPAALFFLGINQSATQGG
jgi:hypothetical protein